MVPVRDLETSRARLLTATSRAIKELLFSENDDDQSRKVFLTRIDTIESKLAECLSRVRKKPIEPHLKSSISSSQRDENSHGEPSVRDQSPSIDGFLKCRERCRKVIESRLKVLDAKEISLEKKKQAANKIRSARAKH